MAILFTRSQYILSLSLFYEMTDTLFQVVGTLNCNTAPTPSDESIEVDHTVEAVGFCPTIPNIAVTATLSGFVTIWDVSTQVSHGVL